MEYLQKNNTSPSSLSVEERLDALVQAIIKDNAPIRRGIVNYDAPYMLSPTENWSKEELLSLSGLLAQPSSNEHERIRRALVKIFFLDYPFWKVPFTEEETYHLLANWKAATESYSFHAQTERLWNKLLKQIEKDGMTDVRKKILLLYRSQPGDYASAEGERRDQRIDFLLQEGGFLIDQNDAWGPVLLQFLADLPAVEKNAWTALFNHGRAAGDKGYPPKKWIEAAAPLVAAIGAEIFSAALSSWLDFNRDLLLALHRTRPGDPDHYHPAYLREVNHNLLKALIWCCGLVNDAALATALDSYAAAAYRKKPGVGSLSARTGNAAMYAFSLLPFKEAVTRLLKFRNRTTNNTILKSIDKMIAEVAARHGQEKDLLEEIGVMDFGLDTEGRKEYWFDDVSCTLTVRATGEVVQAWQRAGKPLKSFPAALKSAHAEALKELKAEVKELEAQLSVQRARIEGYYLARKSWSWRAFEEYYLRHPLVRVLASQLIWGFRKGDAFGAGFLQGEGFVSAAGEPLPSPDSDTIVSLWHPIGVPVEEVVAWRRFLEERRIVQPFKQAFREVYLLTEAELRTETYSNRFAAHILRQHQFAALCRQRGWTYHLMGNWDSHNTPTIRLPHWNLTAQFLVDASGDGPANEVGILSYIATDQVRFYREGTRLPLAEVPPVAFSEIMRDVDLFVGVCSIGNDPAWTDSGPAGYNTYWHAYSFGELTESAQVRGEVLQGLIPRLKIRDRCSFEGKYLKVRGNLRTYKIHMGSGNILMEPNDQYLCIVPEGRRHNEKELLYIPFEGDNLLSIIISKALMLAEDDKITDETILRQLGR